MRRQMVTTMYNNDYITGQHFVSFAYPQKINPHNLQLSTSHCGSIIQAPSTRIRIFSNPQLFLSGYGYRSHASGEFDSESGRKRNPCRVEKNKSATNPITCGRVNPDIFESDDLKSVSSLSPNNKSIWRNNVSGEQSKFILLYGACFEDILVQRMLGY